MVNVSTLKATKIESPKTPGGISKSLLTPCRRLGLSRNWKKAGPSPFVSPLSAENSSNVEVKAQKNPSRKRKDRVEEENKEKDCAVILDNVKNDVTIDDEEYDVPENLEQKHEELLSTPSRHVDLPRRKKSKLLLSEITCKEEKPVQHSDTVPLNDKDESLNDVNEPPRDMLPEEPFKVLSHSKSKSNVKKKQSPMNSPLKCSKVESILENTGSVMNLTNNKLLIKENSGENEEKPKLISPKELTKECVVVIHKKMFKTDKKDSKKKTESSRSLKRNSQIIFDPSDEVPLSNLNKIENVNGKKDYNTTMTIKDDDDFAENNKVPTKKLEHKNTSTTDLKKYKKNTKASKTSTKLRTPIPAVSIEPKPLSQSSNSFDDDEDFFESKKTILVRKTYDKVTKPLKAKSTGSITQKDIDDLKARIEVKKKLLLAKTMTSDTEELRSLIKKWQRGCQEALMELMDLMKTKCPDKQNMDYSEILKTLKIPAVLVGYDSDNDCFNTPDDASIVLSKINNL